MKNFYFLPLRDKPDTCRKENPRGKPMLPTRVWSLEISEYKRLKLLQAVLVLLDHLLNHLAADRASLLGGQVAIVALLQVDAHFVRSFHLETVKTFARLRNHRFVASHDKLHSFNVGGIFAAE